MEYMNHIILLGSLLALVSIVASAVSSRLGAPLLLVFLVLGMLAGEDGPGGIPFNDIHMAQLVGSIALAIIIFDGGLRTRKEVFSVALRPAVSLATLGVIVTAAVVGAFATWLLGLHWMQGLLLGAIIGSTDAAAVFGLLHTAGTQLKQRVESTLVIESASNDPMAIFLTMALVGVLAAGGTSLTPAILVSFVQQFGIGALVGVIGGRLLGALINRLSLVTALYPLLAVTGGVFIFGLAAVLNGSGFLAIYLAGVVLGNMPLQASQNILRVHDGLAWLSQITMFLMLGLLITPHELFEYSFGGAVIATVLILVARPLAVFVSLLPFRFPWREHVFISWVGLRGAVPMILAIFPMTAGLPDAALYFNIAFFVVLSSLVIQGWTIAPAARLLSQEIPPTTEPIQRMNLDIPGHFEREIACYRVLAGSLAANRPIGELSISRDSHITTVVRNDLVMTVNEALTLLPGDLVYIFTDPAHVPELNRLFDPHQAPARLEEHRFYGDFLLDGTAGAGDVADAYGLPIDEARRSETLDGYLRSVFHGRPVVGDRVRLGSAELVVRQIDDGRITRVGLRIRQA
ncbi:MAG TPA: potassium/proton antiporter [Burkholderiales bacterium]|nr:potassium/proton antiporter [Burkholderiales bacterium]